MAKRIIVFALTLVLAVQFALPGSVFATDEAGGVDSGEEIVTVTSEEEEGDGESTESVNTEGEITEGGNAEGENAEGGDTEGENTEGESTEGGDTEGENTEGGNTEGENSEGESTEGTEGEGTDEGTDENTEGELPLEGEEELVGDDEEQIATTAFVFDESAGLEGLLTEDGIVEDFSVKGSDLAIDNPTLVITPETVFILKYTFSIMDNKDDETESAFAWLKNDVKANGKSGPYKIKDFPAGLLYDKDGGSQIAYIKDTDIQFAIVKYVAGTTGEETKAPYIEITFEGEFWGIDAKEMWGLVDVEIELECSLDEGAIDPEGNITIGVGESAIDLKVEQDDDGLTKTVSQPIVTDEATEYEWTVKYTPTTLPVTEVVLTDTLTGVGHKYVDGDDADTIVDIGWPDGILYSGDGVVASVEMNEDGTGFILKLPRAAFGGVLNRNGYTFTYRTRLNGSWDGKPLGNTIAGEKDETELKATDNVAELAIPDSKMKPQKYFDGFTEDAGTFAWKLEFDTTIGGRSIVNKDSEILVYDFLPPWLAGEGSFSATVNGEEATFKRIAVNEWPAKLPYTPPAWWKAGDAECNLYVLTIPETDPDEHDGCYKIEYTTTLNQKVYADFLAESDGRDFSHINTAWLVYDYLSEKDKTSPITQANGTDRKGGGVGVSMIIVKGKGQLSIEGDDYQVKWPITLNNEMNILVKGDFEDPLSGMTPAGAMYYSTDITQVLKDGITFTGKASDDKLNATVDANGDLLLEGGAKIGTAKIGEDGLEVHFERESGVGAYKITFNVCTLITKEYYSDNDVAEKTITNWGEFTGTFKLSELGTEEKTISSDDWDEVKLSDVILAKKVDSVDYAKQTIKWAITVNSRGAPIGAKVVLTEKLGKDLKLMKNEDGTYAVSATNGAKITEIKESEDVSEGEAWDITVETENGKGFTVYVTTKIDFSGLKDVDVLYGKGDDEFEVGNAVSLSGISEDNASGNASVTMPKDAITKAVISYANGYATYRVYINPNAVDLSGGITKVYLEDILPEDMKLVPRSDKMYTASVPAAAPEAWKELAPFSGYKIADIEDNKGRTTGEGESEVAYADADGLPDGFTVTGFDPATAYIFEYECEYVGIKEEGTLTNHVKLVGTGEYEADPEEIDIREIKMKASGNSGPGKSYGQITVRKVDAETGEPMAGVTFELTSSLNKYTNFANPIEGTTGADGVFIFQVLNPNRCYKLKETSKHDGYIDAQPGVVSVKDDDGVAIDTAGKAFDAIVFELKKMEGGKVIGLAAEVTVENSRKTFDFSFLKVDRYGRYLTDAEFTLTGPGGPFTAVSRTLEDGRTTGVVTFGGIPWGEFKLYESRAPYGYTLNRSVYDVLIDKNGVIVIKLNGKVVGEGKLEENGLSVINDRRHTPPPPGPGEDPGPGPEPGPDPSDTPYTPPRTLRTPPPANNLITINDEAVPLGVLGDDGLVTISDEMVPLAGVTDWIPVIILLALLGGALVAAGLVVKKRSVKHD